MHNHFFKEINILATPALVLPGVAESGESD